MNSVIKYFNEEKTGSYIILIMGVISLAMALYFIFMLKTSFWKGAAIPFIIVALLEIPLGYTIALRSPKDILRIENYIENQPEKIKSEEIPRMEKVMKGFVNLRYAEIVFILLGIILMYSTKHDSFWQGIGFGLFIQACIILGFDFLAEKRGYVYMEYLNQFNF